MTTSQSESQDDPYCSNCGYALAGLTESSKCPECGRPLVDVLARRSTGPAPMRGVRRRTRARMLGWPVLDIAMGPHRDEHYGRPRGVIAIGDRPIGMLAIGGLARGFVTIGGMAIGVLSIGGLAIGALSAVGGMAIGGAASGGAAVGGLASGGGAAGVVAQGGGAYGFCARGGSAWGTHTIDFGGAQSTIADDMFRQFDWFFGSGPFGTSSFYQPMVVLAAVTIAACLLIGLLALLAWSRNPGWETSDT